MPACPYRPAGRLLVAVLVSLAIPLAWAAVPGPVTEGGLDGEWAVTLRTEDGGRFPARLDLNGATGRWKATVHAQRNPCVGRQVAVQVLALDPSHAELLLEFDKALLGCQNLHLQLERVSREEWRGQSQAVADIGAMTLSLRRP